MRATKKPKRVGERQSTGLLEAALRRGTKRFDIRRKMSIEVRDCSERKWSNSLAK